MTRLVLLALVALPATASAAAPTLTHLHPAGGKRGTTVSVTLGGTFERWPVSALVSGKGVTAKAGDKKGQLTFTIAADATPGPRWLRVWDDQGASAAKRFVVGTLDEVAEKEPNDDARKAQVIAGDAVVNGRLEKAGDVDCFALKLKKGQTLVASLLANRVLGSPMDGVLQVLSDKGFVVAQNNDHAGLDPQVTHVASEDGTYVVRLFAFPEVADSSVGYAGGERFIYRLTLTTSGFADHAWPLAAKRGKGVGLVGWNLGKGVTADVVETESDEGIAVAKGVAGDALVRLEAHECATRVSGDEVQPLTLPVTVSGRIAKAREKHTYEIAGRKGQRLEAIIESARAGYSLDGVLTLRDKAGKMLTRAQAPALHRDAELAYVLPGDGAYRLEVSDAQADGGPRHLYRLRVLDGAPDYALSVAADRFVIPRGKTLDVVVSVVRRNGFVGDVTLTAEGVKAEPVPGAKGALTLRLSAPEKAGAFRIVGKAKDGVRVARGEAGEWLWVGVGK